MLMLRQSSGTLSSVRYHWETSRNAVTNRMFYSRYTAQPQPSAAKTQGLPQPENVIAVDVVAPDWHRRRRPA